MPKPLEVELKSPVFPPATEVEKVAESPEGSLKVPVGPLKSKSELFTSTNSTMSACEILGLEVKAKSAIKQEKINFLFIVDTLNLRGVYKKRNPHLPFFLGIYRFLG